MREIENTLEDKKQNMLEVITPTWPAPKKIKAYSTTRHGGVSQGAFASLNLGLTVGDDSEAVHRNRNTLIEKLNLPMEPCWLKQVHGVEAVAINKFTAQTKFCADAAYTCEPDVVCAVQTADCLPVLLCDVENSCVAVIHAGWRGLVRGVIEQTVKSLPVPATRLLAWLGPAIGPKAFEVGADVYNAFVELDAQAATAFNPISFEKWLANIYLLAKQRLYSLGITAIYGGDYCTYENSETFFSHRRDKGVTGRMATLIWLES